MTDGRAFRTKPSSPPSGRLPYACAAPQALVNGRVGVIVASRERLFMVLRFNITNGKIIEIEAVSDPDRLRQLDLAILNG